MSEVLATYPSSSGNGTYEVRRSDRDGVTFCTCPGWRNCKKVPKTCKHLKMYGAGEEPAPAVEPAKDKPPLAMLGHQVEKAPVSPWGRDDWSMEIKYDGMRIFWMQNDRPRQFARSHAEHTGRYPWLDEVRMPEGTVLDGELCPPGEVSHYAMGSRTDLVYVVFDVLQVGEHQLKLLPWVERRAILEMVVAELAHPLVVPSKLMGTPDLNAAQDLAAAGAEGVMLKRRQSVYEAGKRSWDWLKWKVTTTVDVVITDMDALPTAEDRIAAGWRNLRYGFYDVKGKLFVAGTLGVTGPPEELVQHVGRCCEVKAYGQGKTGAIRHPVFLRWRDDKRPDECIWENGARGAGLEAP